MAGMKLAVDGRRARHRGNRLEYNFYYAAIFVAALPMRCVHWLYDLCMLNDAALKDSVVARVRRDAAELAPWIFSR